MCSTKCRARGLSLIEVVLGLAILGTFLSTIFIAQARLIRQSTLAKDKAQVIGAVDTLLATWATDWQNLPAEDSGTLAGYEQWQWQTRLVEDDAFTSLGLQKVELTVTDPENQSVEPLLVMELAIGMPREDVPESTPVQTPTDNPAEPNTEPTPNQPEVSP